MALALLADRWARARAGRVVALTVDHGLRAGSAAEATQVGRWLAARGIEHHVLTWRGAKPATGIQARARDARRALLEDWCRAHGVLHLLLGHQAQDQAETTALRASRGSGVVGRAGMSAILETRDARIVRPLLDVPRARLVATLRDAGQAWIDDPSNIDPRFARARLRGECLAPPDDPARRLDHETALARALARHAAIFPEGHAVLGLGFLAEDLAGDVLARAALTVGGGTYPPRGPAVARLVAELRRDPRARTLGGCRVLPSGHHVLLVREAGACPRSNVTAPGRYFWDDRFHVDVRRLPDARGALTIAALGDESVPFARELKALAGVPAAALAALPVLRDLDGVVAAPHLMGGRAASGPDSLTVRFEPRRGLTDPLFAPALEAVERAPVGAHGATT